MRQSTFIAAMVGLLAAAPAFAQPQLPQQPQYQEAVILQNEIEVRSGPSKNFFPTSKLFRNDKVYVLRQSKDAPDWLEIKPPTGSFSWVNAKYVKQIDGRQAYVECDPTRPVPILPGSTLVNQEPNREVMKLTAGTIVVIVDRPLSVNGETWLPIQPHSNEVRYIPADAVQRTQVIAATAGPVQWNRTPDGFTGNSVLADAQQAERSNDISRARQLYQLIANNSTDQNQKAYAMNRLAALPQGGVPGQTTSNSGYNPAPPGPSMSNLVQTQAAAWTTYGRLRDTKLTREDGQPIFSLEDAQGKVINYVTTAPGKSLQSYVGRMVAVYGPTMYRADSAARMQYVVASHVAVP